MSCFNYAAIVLLVVLNACSLLPEQSDHQYQLSSMRSMRDLQQWSLDGRFAYQDGKESFSVSVIWVHDRDHEQITLSGPLSQGKVVIDVAPEQVVMNDGNELRTYQGQPDAVVAEQLGLVMPVAALKYWVLGIYDPNKPHVEMVDGFSQEGWTVLYREMQAVGAQLMPRKILIEQGQTKIKFLVDLWKIS